MVAAAAFYIQSVFFTHWLWSPGPQSQETSVPQPGEDWRPRGTVDRPPALHATANVSLRCDVHRDEPLRELRQERAPRHRLAVFRQHGGSGRWNSNTITESYIQPARSTRSVSPCALTQVERTASTSPKWRLVPRWAATWACQRRSWAEWTPAPWGRLRVACSATLTCACTTAPSSACTSDTDTQHRRADWSGRVVLRFFPSHSCLNKTLHFRISGVTWNLPYSHHDQHFFLLLPPVKWG